MADWVAIRAKFRAECAEIVGEVAAPPPRQRVVATLPEKDAHLFFVGPPCMRGHSGLRYRATRACVDCNKLKQRDVRAHREHDPKDVERGISLTAIYYEQEFDRAGWRHVHALAHWEDL